MTDDLVESLLASESVAAAVELARRSRIRPRELAGTLLAYAERMRPDRPATAAAASFLAEVVGSLEVANAWVAQDHFPDEANELLTRASLAGGWPGALRVLRGHRHVFDHDMMMSVVFWHSGFAQQGVPPEANGAAVVITLGALLGGKSLALAHMAWARACENTSLAHAEFHFLRAQELAAVHGDDVDRHATASALDSFRDRFGVPRERADAIPDAPLTIGMIPVNESNAASLRDSGRYLEALALLDRTIPFALEAGVLPNAMRMLNDRGLLHDDLGNYALASENFTESARLAGLLKDEGRRFEARNNAAASYLKRGQPLQAVPLFRGILREQDAAGVWPRRMAARNNLATTYASLGDHERARDLYAEVVTMMGDLYSPSLWIALTGLAAAYDSLGQTEELRAVGERMWRGWTERQDVQALQAYLNSAARDLTNPEVRDVAEQMWAALVRQGDVFQGAALTVALSREDAPELAVQRLDAFLNAFEAERSAVPSCISAELEAAKIEAEVLDRGDAALTRLYTAIGRVEQRLGQIEQPYDRDWVLDQTRPLYLRLFELLLAGPTFVEEALQVHEASRPATLTAADGLAGRVASAQDVLRVLSPDVAVISFAETGSAVSAFVLTGGVRWVPLDVTPAQLGEAAMEISVAFNGAVSGLARRRPLAVRNLGKVDLCNAERVLSALGEVLSLVEGAQTVCVIPSAGMEGLPLAAMRAPSGKRLVEMAGVVHLSSLTAFVTTAVSDPPRVPRKVFVAGVADAETDTPEHFEADAGVFTRGEVTVVTGERATPAAVVAGIREADIAHVSCHGFVDARDPFGSGLLLSDGTRRPSSRHHLVPVFERAAFELTVRDLAREQLRTELLTLRACSTARRSAVSAKEELGTLTRVLQAAGCRTVVSTLWNVDQRSSLALFARFYELYLNEGLPACQAMARAQREMIDSGQHVYHWAPFVVSGDWRTSR
jgi:tetratricopeptide (TPR) repeat protein